MNRRDAIKAAVAGVATAMVPMVSDVPPYKVMKVSLPTRTVTTLWKINDGKWVPLRGKWVITSVECEA